MLKLTQISHSAKTITTFLHFPTKPFVVLEEVRNGPMRKESKSNSGIEMLLKFYRSVFRVPENLNHYSKGDYKEAERKFLKYALEQRRIEILEEPFKGKPP